MAAAQASGERASATDPLARDVLFRQVGALVGTVLLAFLAIAMRTAPPAEARILLGVSTLTAGTLAVVLVRTPRIPPIVHQILPFAYLLVVCITRDATGGVSSSYLELALLPMLWVAVYGSTLELGGVMLATVSVLAYSLARAGAPEAAWLQMLSMLALGATLAYIVCRFFGQIRRQTGKLRVLAGTDPLTGTANRRAWDEEVASAIEDAKLQGRPMSLALIDLDDFKGFNDRFGHQAGDRLLKEATSAWQAILRMSDVLARVGGDEFAVLLPACTLEMAAQIAERLRAAVPAAGCSVGVAAWDGLEVLEALLARADAALYEAKDGGRGRVVVAGDGRHPIATE